jgi:hypothetical protein
MQVNILDIGFSMANSTFGIVLEIPSTMRQMRKLHTTV